MTVEEVAEEVGVSRATLYNRLGQAGISGGRRRNLAPASPPTLDQSTSVEMLALEMRAGLAEVRASIAELRSLIIELRSDVRGR
jgi:hypothetical protein